MTESNSGYSRREPAPRAAEASEVLRNDNINTSRKRLLARALLTGALTASLIMASSSEAGSPVDAPNPTIASPLAEPTLKSTTAPGETSTEGPAPTEIPKAPEAETQAYPDTRFESFASWSQDFSKEPDGPLNQDSWNIYTGPAEANNELQYYSDSPENVRIEDGNLVLQAHHTEMGERSYTSGRINTLGKQDFMYGKLEVEAKLPLGVGTWSAIWMLPSEHRYNGQPIPHGASQYTLNGEIDIAETMGVEPNKIYCIAHAIKKPTDTPYPLKYYSTLQVPDSHEAFHTYGVSWTPEEITYTIDGQECYSVKKEENATYLQWPYDQPYNLILNLAIGGNWIAGDPKQYPPDGIDKAMLPASVQVASINYFPLITD